VQILKKTCQTTIIVGCAAIFGSKRIFIRFEEIKQQIFAWMWNLLQVSRIFASNEYFEANMCQCKKILSENSWSEYSLHQIEYLYANLCEYFETNMKRVMWINGVCEYTETCEYLANKIHICLDLLRSKYKKAVNTAHLHYSLQRANIPG
jgi:hypothetical protein